MLEALAALTIWLAAILVGACVVLAVAGGLYVLLRLIDRITSSDED